MTISKKTLEFTFGIDSRESGTSNLWSKMRTKDYDPHGGHVIMAVRPFWDEGLIQWLPCWWWGTLKKLQLPQCGGWFVGLFVVQMASMKIKIRYDGLHRPQKKHKTTHWKQHPRATTPSTKDLTVLLKKVHLNHNEQEDTDTWKKARFSGPSVERCDRFPAVINKVEASEAFCGSQYLRKNDEKPTKWQQKITQF